MDEEALKAEKMRLENILKELCRQTESEQQNEIINLLKEYNSVKDAVQILIGELANIENVTVKEIHERMNLHAGD